MADLHVHSSFSDGKLSVAELVDFYGSLGFGAIAVTDHLCETETLIGKAAHFLKQTLTPDGFSIYLDTIKREAERAWKKYRLVLLPGFELSKNSISNHRSAHILGIGVSRYTSADGDVTELIKQIKNQGAIAIAAHPVSTRKLEKQTYHLWDRRRELASHFDAWEVASGPFLFDEVAQSRLPVIATSDLHHPKQIRSWKTVFHCERHPEAILAAIRSQNLDVRFYSGTVLAPALLHSEL